MKRLKINSKRPAPLQACRICCLSEEVALGVLAAVFMPLLLHPPTARKGYTHFISTALTLANLSCATLHCCSCLHFHIVLHVNSRLPSPIASTLSSGSSGGNCRRRNMQLRHGHALFNVRPSPRVTTTAENIMLSMFMLTHYTVHCPIPSLILTC